MPINSIGISQLDPVVYCGGDTQGGPNEYDAPAGSPAQYTLDANNPPGTRVISAWYQPYDNIKALPAFHTIHVTRHDDSHINLIASSEPGQSNRIRLIISVLWES